MDRALYTEPPVCPVTVQNTPALDYGGQRWLSFYSRLLTTARAPGMVATRLEIKVILPQSLHPIFLSPPPHPPPSLTVKPWLAWNLICRPG